MTTLNKKILNFLNLNLTSTKKNVGFLVNPFWTNKKKDSRLEIQD